jgi:alkaline phosphatase D
MIARFAMALLLCACYASTVSGQRPTRGEYTNQPVQPPVTRAAAEVLQSGPMLGYNEMREVMLWVQTTRPAQVWAEYWEKSKPETRYKTETVTTTAQDAHTAHLLCNQVWPGKQYEYQVVVDGQAIKRPYPTEFKTQALWRWRKDDRKDPHIPYDYKFAVGSCAYINDTPVDRINATPYGSHYEIFTALHRQRPDFMLWAGDNTYTREADWNTRTGFLYRYTHTRSLPELQPLLASTHHYAIWDDHDYGPNDSDQSYWGKNMAQDVFKLFWGNPAYGLGVGGCTFTFEWGDSQFFMLDDRWNRTANDRATGSPQMFGRAQLEWLVNALKSSTATFKFVVNGNCVLNPAKRGENFANYEAEYKWLLETLKAEKIPGIVFLSGDIHHSELTKLDVDGLYALYDWTVSPLTSGTSNGKEDGRPDLVKGSVVNVHNFGIIEVTGNTENRQLTLGAYDSQGTRQWSYVIKASELRPK